ncbi:MAG: tyrosine-type recombinase/integrase [Clostridia bacterium]|nr:tyrosine-type recombinase/integrase [Clostridia bacterium]
MANIQERRDKSGKLISYSIRVHRGRGADGHQLKPWTATFPVEPTWTEKSARKKAEAFAATFEKECREGTRSDTRQTIEQYTTYCIDLKEQRGAKVSTVTLYRSLSSRLIFPFIGHIKLKDIKPQHLNDLYTELSKEGKHKNGGRLSGKTILEVHRLLHTVLEQAMMEGLIPYNPAARVEPPKREKSDPVYYQPEEVSAILSALEEEGEQWRMLVLLLLVSGCRRGEALGLKWEDVSFEYNRIHICRNVLYTKEKGVYVDTPKTENSTRYVTIPADIMAELRKHKAWQSAERMRLGTYYENEGYVFTQENGSPLHPCSVTSWMTKFSKRHGLPHLNAHGFRHTMASMLIYNGVDPVTVSHRLGHDQVSTTTNIYSHMIADADSRSADVIADALTLKKA